MEWVEPFYARQHELLRDYYQAPVADHHRVIAALIPVLASPPPGRVLELGAGGGQVAAATAALGYDVTAVELIPAAADHARALAEPPHSPETPGISGRLRVVTGDFYEVTLPGGFAVVTYWDGFGIGDDEDQRRLLRRIAGWLAPAGHALLEVLTPWYWAGMEGVEQIHGPMSRRYDFDADGGRMLDHNWPTGDPSGAVTQSLRCYGPADLRLLLAGTGLALTAVRAGGGLDRASGAWHEHRPLGAAMSFVAVLRPEAGSGP